MESAIDQIHQGHINISKILNIMDRELVELDQGNIPNFDILEDSMRYMVNYADLIHHSKEDAVFALLVSRLPEVEIEIAEIKDQHLTLARMSNHFYEIVKEASVGEVLRTGFRKKGVDYIETLRAHMNIEESSLLKKAKSVFSEEDLFQIYKDYESFRDPLLGDSIEKKYRNLYSYITE